MTSSFIQPVLSLLQKPEDTESEEIAKQVDADIAAASTLSKEDEEIERQVDADIAAAQKPPEELDVFGEKKDPLTKGIEYVQSGIEGMIQSGEEDYPIVNELSKRLQEAGPNKFDEYDKDIVSTLNPKEVKKLLERQPWVYATLTPEQKAEQFKQSRESDISTLGAVGRAVGQVANFGLDLVKAGANYGWDQTYAEGIAPLLDVYNDQMPRDAITGKIKSLTGGPAQVKARERVSADLRNMAGAWANTIIESQRQIERYSGGTGEGYKFLIPSPQKISESVAKSPQAASAVAMFPMLGPAAAFSPLFLSTKMAEAGKDPNSGYAAFIDQINEKLGFQNESMSEKHFDNRKLYDAEKSAEDWNAGQGAELVSPWSKMAFSPVFQYLNLQRNAWMLPNAETYAKLKNISVEEAKDDLANKADENSEKGLRALADKMNKEYDPSMELLGSMAMGDAALDVAGIAVGGTRLLGKGISNLETAGMTPAQINALMTARQARQKEILAESIANAQKRSVIGGAAKTTEDFQKAALEKATQTFEKLPTVVKEYGPGVLSQVGLGAAGGTAGYFLNPEDQVSGALKGLTLTGAAGLTPGLLRSIDDARMLRAGGSPLGAGTFEIAGKLPTSSKTTKVLFGGKRGAAVDYLTDNLHTLGRAGVNFGAINAINSAINSDDPERFIDSVAEGIAMGVGFKMLGKIHGSDPEEELSNRKRKDVEIYLSRQRQSDATQNNMDELRNYQNYVDSSQMNVDKMQGFLAQAEQEGDPQKIESAQKAVDVAQSVHNQILTANVQTRNEMGRMMDEIYSDANSLLNGARKVGQQNVKLEVLTTPQIVELLSKQFPDKSADELIFAANQRGFFIPETSTSVVNFDRIIRRQQMTGESLTDSFRHEALGHGLWSIKEFRDLNKNADNLLFEQVIRDLRGDVVDIKPGKYTEDELFDMYSTHYLKGKSPEQINQYAQESGLWNSNTNSLDRAKIIEAVKDEIRAELIAGNLEQGFGKMKQQSRSIDDWVSLRAKTNFLARAMQNAAGIGAKPFESKLLGISYDPEVVAANRRAIEAMRNYNGEFEDAPETKKGVDIPEKTMRNDPVMRKRYGLNGGEYQTTLYAEVRDADGKVIGQKVPVTSENAKEGTWVNDAQTGQTKQTKGYGQVPVEFAQMQIPVGGSLNIVTDFIYEADGKTPVRRKDKELEKLDEDRRVAIKNAVDSASDRYSDPRWFKPYSEDGESYDGLFSPEQIKNIKNLPESVLPLSIKEKIIALNQIMLMGDGSTIEIDYGARLLGKKYKGRRSEIYSLIPGGKFQLSKATNFTFNAVSRGAWLRKIKARKDRMPGWFNAWGNDTGLFERELQEKYLANTYAKRPGWYGLDPENPTEKTPLAEEKWNKFKDFLNMVAKDIPTVDNPWRMKTPAAKGRQGKAEGDVDNLWRKFRLDAIADWADSTDATGRYTMGWDNIYKQLMPIDEAGEPTEFKTPEQQRQGSISARFMPERMEGEVPIREDWDEMLNKSLKMSYDEFVSLAKKGKLIQATGEENPFVAGTGETPLSYGAGAGYSLPDIVHFYSIRTAPMDAAYNNFLDNAEFEKISKKGVKMSYDEFISSAKKGIQFMPERPAEQEPTIGEKTEISPKIGGKKLKVSIDQPFDEFGDIDYDAEDAVRKIAKDRNLGITSDRELAFVAKDENGEIVGGAFTSADQNGYTFDVIVSKEAEGKGVGSKLLDEVINPPYEITDAYPDAKVKVDVVNPSMKKMLENRGFIVEEKIGKERWIMVPQEPTISEKPQSSEMIGADTIKPADLQTSAKPEVDAVIKPFSNALISSAGLINFLPAYHGTPFEVDKFKLANIGTGEGAQAYGWGLYFAQARKVGEDYRKKLAKFGTKKDPWFAYEVREGLAKGEDWNTAFQKTYSRASNEVKKAMDAWTGPNDVMEPTGNLYKVDIDVKDEDLLDWDKPLSEQPESVRDAITALINERTPKEIADVFLSNAEAKGGSLYALISDSFGESAQGTPEKRASEALFAAGIPGIRYLDGGSRLSIKPPETQAKGHQWEVVDGAGKLKAREPNEEAARKKMEAMQTYNYVVFDENLITILDKNDKPVAGELPTKQPLSGIQFMPARKGDKKPKAAKKELEREIEPDFTHSVGAKLPTQTPERGYFKIATNPTEDGRVIEYELDPQTTVLPNVAGISSIGGEQVAMLEADRHNTRGSNMGGPLHPWLVSNQAVAKLPDGRGFKPVWANMTAAFVTRAKNVIKNTTSGMALIQLMKEKAHKSNRKFVQDVMSEVDSMSTSIPQERLDALHVILELGAKNPDKHLKRYKKAQKLLKDNEITQSEFNLIERFESENIEKYKPSSDFLSALGSMKSQATKGNIAAFDKSFDEHISKYKDQNWYKKIVNKYKNKTFAEEASKFTFNQRGSAMDRISGIPFIPSIAQRLLESMDFNKGKNLDIVAAVQLSKDMDAFAIYTGDDPKQEAKMSATERYLRDEFLKNPQFRIHPSYDWMMLGPEDANNFILETPADPVKLFPDYASSHPKKTVREGSKETIVGTMKKSKIPLILK
jgi:ribosomal protein S18 acetylase RimI-like enzyme